VNNTDKIIKNYKYNLIGGALIFMFVSFMVVSPDMSKNIYLLYIYRYIIPAALIYIVTNLEQFTVKVGATLVLLAMLVLLIIFIITKYSSISLLALIWIVVSSIRILLKQNIDNNY
jgi:hypothetical protein